ncbi:hypothetical protein HY572_06310 [Candidatus Micrarchaeota archaeon]|nr:hypothetical protein [Candidatus Micrarchaeota archaeon]
MIAGLDWGGSFADAVLWKEELSATYSVPSRQTTAENLLAGLLSQENLTAEKLEYVAVTGGDQNRVGKTLFGVPVRVQDEIQSIARGAHHASKKNEAVAVSCGTGTAIVYFLQDEGFHVLHLGGTAVGGGTLEGLARAWLGVEVTELEKLAQTGQALDLTVGDIVGSGIGMVPADATASHLAKATKDAKPEDAAKSLLHLVAETIGTVASLAADKTGCNELVFTGRVAKNKAVQERIEKTTKLYGKNAHFPENGEYATAIGAAIQSKTS